MINFQNLHLSVIHPVPGADSAVESGPLSSALGQVDLGEDCIALGLEGQTSVTSVAIIAFVVSYAGV